MPSVVVSSAGEVAFADLPSPMADLPVGATFGSLVHAVLEHADPQATDLRAELLATLEEQLLQWPVDLDRGDLADALVTVCRTPLGPLAGSVTLADIGRSDRLCELDFELRGGWPGSSKTSPPRRWCRATRLPLGLDRDAR